LIVADTNLIVALACKTDHSRLAFAVHQKDPDWIAPTVWQSEFRNAVLGKIGYQTMACCGAAGVAYLWHEHCLAITD
jgi:hypothetical protein